MKYLFYLPKDPKSTKFIIDAQFKGVRAAVHFEAGEQGEKDLADVLAYFPKLVDAIKKEQEVRREMEDVEKDLLDLLGDE